MIVLINTPVATAIYTVTPVVTYMVYSIINISFSSYFTVAKIIRHFGFLFEY